MKDSIRAMPMGQSSLIGLFASLLLFVVHAIAHAETISIVGQTRLPTLPDSAVTIRVGDQSTIAVADADGRFSADVEVDPGSELVRVEACGVGDQTHICFVRLIHTASEILARASATGSYQVGDLSPVSTAGWAALLKPNPNQVIPVTLADIEQFQFGFVTFVLTDAALLALIAHGKATMPAGAADFVSLLLDPALRSSALGSVSFELLSQQLEAIVQNDNFMLRPEDDFDILGKTYFVPLGTEMQNFQSSRIELNSGGSGNYATGPGSGDATWTNVGAGELIFRDNMEPVGTGTRYISLTANDRDSIIPPNSGFLPNPDGPGTIRVEQRVTEVQWRQLDASELLGIAVQRTTTETVAPDRPDLGPGQIAQLGVSTSSQDAISRSDTADVPTSPLPTSGSQWAFPRCETDCTTQGFIPGIPSSDVLSFNLDGTASAKIFDPGLNWAVSEGRVLIDQDDGYSLKVLPLSTARRAGASFGDLEATLMVTEVTTPDGGLAITSNFVLEADSGFALTEQSVPGTYNLHRLFSGTFILEAGGSGWRRPLGSVNPGDPLPSDPPNLNWSISPTGDLVLAVSGFTVASTPVRASQKGFYSISRWNQSGADLSAAGGPLVFWESISN